MQIEVKRCESKCPRCGRQCTLEEGHIGMHQDDADGQSQKGRPRYVYVFNHCW